MHKSICAGRRRLLAAASFSAALIITGCDKKAPAVPASLLERVRAKGEMLIGTEGTWAPWCYHDASGALTGFDVELGRLIAKKNRRQGGFHGRQMGRSARRARRRPI